MTTFNLPLILKTTNKFLSLMFQSNALITTPSQHSFTARKLSLDFMLYNTVMTFIWVKRSVVYMIEALAKNCQTSAIADHITSTGHNIKWDHLEILATGRSDIHCRIKEYLLIKDLAKLQNTLPFICISLNKNSIFNNYSTSARWV